MLSLLLVLTANASIDFREVDEYRLGVMRRGSVRSAHKMEREKGIAELFVGAGLETSFNKLVARGLSQGRVAQRPWSGHTWENYAGGLGLRWADASFPREYGRARDYVRQNPWDQTLWHKLSPAEKYDHLTGVRPDERGSLTQHQWNLGAEEYRTTGRIARWQGICHGWSPASIYLPRPLQDVTFKFPEGDLIFTVDDIKALGALYWANGKYQAVFAGWRCNQANPGHNGEGRILDPKCFDVNPGDWHLALTNMVGARKESFILDAAETSEVWNHPIVAYSLQYFDATNFEQRSSSPQGLLRLRTQSPNLRHGQFRSPKTVWVIGVVATVTIADGADPGDRRDLQKDITFTYDLELDENYRIIGGEWRNKDRPDFLWRRKEGQVPAAVGRDVQLDMWRMGDENWRRASLENSAQGVPVKFFVEQLFQMSAAQ